MTRAEKARAFFEAGYNCAQSTAMAFSKDIGLDEKYVARLISGFGGGFSLKREICGAVSGITFVMGALKGYDKPNDLVIKRELYDKVRALIDQFEEQKGSLLCREFLGLKKGEFEPVPSERTPEYYKNRPCGELVYQAARILEDAYFKET